MVGEAATDGHLPLRAGGGLLCRDQTLTDDSKTAVGALVDELGSPSPSRRSATVLLLRRTAGDGTVVAISILATPVTRR